GGPPHAPRGPRRSRGPRAAPAPPVHLPSWKRPRRSALLVPPRHHPRADDLNLEGLFAVRRDRRHVGAGGRYDVAFRVEKLKRQLHWGSGPVVEIADLAPNGRALILCIELLDSDLGRQQRVTDRQVVQRRVPPPPELPRLGHE